MTDLAARFRREGQADAVVLLVAKRVAPFLDLEDWARALGLTQPEVKAAIARYRERCVQAGLPKGTQPPALRLVKPKAPVADQAAKVLAKRNAEIYDRWLAGEPPPDLAKVYDLTPERIRQIVRAAS